MNILLGVLFFLECLAFILSLVQYPKLKTMELRLLPYYLGFLVIAESVGHTLNYFQLKTQTRYLHEYLVIPAEFVFLYYLFTVKMKSKNSKLIFIACSSLYLLVLLLDNLIKLDSQLSSISYTLGNLLLLLLVLRFLFYFVRSDSILFFKKEIMFYMTCGVLVFYLGSFPFFAFKNYLWAHYTMVGYYYWHAMMVMNCIMYAIFSLGIVCSKEK